MEDTLRSLIVFFIVFTLAFYMTRNKMDRHTWFLVGIATLASTMLSHVLHRVLPW